jgi:hypothetical protein
LTDGKGYFSAINEETRLPAARNLMRRNDGDAFHTALGREQQLQSAQRTFAMKSSYGLHSAALYV